MSTVSRVPAVTPVAAGSPATGSVRSSEAGWALGRPLIWGDVEGSQTATFALPAGTVTFLLSDIEGSTRLWQDEPEAMAHAVPEHYALLEEAVALHGGVRPVEQGEGDSIVVAFSRGSDAVAAALEIQRRMGAHAWPEGPALRVRVALHTAEAQLRDEGNYFGLALSRCARLRELAHGGQVLLSGATHDLVVDRLPTGARTGRPGGAPSARSRPARARARAPRRGCSAGVSGAAIARRASEQPSRPADQLRRAGHRAGRDPGGAGRHAAADPDRGRGLREDPAGAADGCRHGGPLSRRQLVGGAGPGPRSGAASDRRWLRLWAFARWAARRRWRQPSPTSPNSGP